MENITDLLIRYNEFVDAHKETMDLTPVTEYVSRLQDIADGIENSPE